jgi:hypothetical protein
VVVTTENTETRSLCEKLWTGQPKSSFQLAASPQSDESIRAGRTAWRTLASSAHQGLSSQPVFRAQPQCQPLVVAGRRANRLVRSLRSRIPRKQQQQQHSPSNDIHPTPVVGEDPIRSQGASPTPASGLSRARPCGLSKVVRESSLIFAANAIRRWEARMDAVIVWWSPLCSS